MVAEFEGVQRIRPSHNFEELKTGGWGRHRYFPWKRRVVESNNASGGSSVGAGGGHAAAELDQPRRQRQQQQLIVADPSTSTTTDRVDHVKKQELEGLRKRRLSDMTAAEIDNNVARELNAVSDRVVKDGDVVGGAEGGEKEGNCKKKRVRRAAAATETVRVRVGLTRQQVEEDIVKIMGQKAGNYYNSRHRKRRRKPQDDLGWLCPGSSLKGISLSTYKITRH